MVELLGAPRFSYGWSLRGPPVFEKLDSQRPPVFVWLDFQRLPGIRVVELLEAPRFFYGWIRKTPSDIRMNRI